MFPSRTTVGLMNKWQTENDCIQPLEFWDLEESSPLMEVPVQFVTDLPQFVPIKIQPQHSMNHPLQTITIPQKPLIPALFQIAARAEEVESMPLLKNAVVRGHGPMAEMMLDPEKLEAVLKAISKKRKPAVRRVTASRLSRRAVGDSAMI